MLKKNTPYRKKFVNGILSNPITKDKPFLNSAVHPMLLNEFYNQTNGTRKIWRTVQNKFFKGQNAVKVV